MDSVPRPLGDPCTSPQPAEDGSEQPKPLESTSSPAAAPVVRALVLSGGGARGAYEVGVAKALLERGIHFDYVFGTSVGAINATGIAQGSIDQLEKLWTSTRAKELFRFPSGSQLRRMIFGQRLGFLDASALEEILKREIDFEKLKASKTRAGFITTDLCSLETRLITSDEIESKEDLVDILMASSALPLLFPPRQIKGEGLWIDGGLVRNTPIHYAIRLGAREIFAVLVEPSTKGECPTSIVELLTRSVEIMLDASARSGIAAVHQYNRGLTLKSANGNGNGNTNESSDGNGSGNGGNRNAIVDGEVMLRIIKPRRPIVGSLLDVDPIASRYLIHLGYEDTIRGDLHV